MLSGRLEGTTIDQISEILRVRIEQLSNVTHPFGKPSDASKKKVESGLVKLNDGVIIRVEKADQAFVFAISKKFDIDEVEAFILLRSFLYNEGLPANTSGASSSAALIDELIDAITPFYYSERLYVLRVLIPLFRANAGGAEPVSTIANDFLPRIIPDGKGFARTLIEEYSRKSESRVPESTNVDARKAAQWARQNAKEQLVLLEVLFWTMWDYASCDGQLVVQIYQTAYDTNLGSEQANATLLLDDEGSQVLQDSAALWMLIMIEVLELERVAAPGGIEISDTPLDTAIYWSSPEYMNEIHNLVTAYPHSQFGCAYIGWSFFLSKFVDTCRTLPTLPQPYLEFYESVVPAADRSYTKEGEPAHIIMSKAALKPEAGLFSLMLTLTTNSALFVTSVAWKTGSSVTDPNAVAYRSVLKGAHIDVYFVSYL